MIIERILAVPHIFKHTLIDMGFVEIYKKNSHKYA